MSLREPPVPVESIDKLVDYYLNLPSIQDRADLSAYMKDKFMSGEKRDIDLGLQLRELINSPFFTGLGTTSLTFMALLELDLLPQTPTGEDALKVMGIYFAETLGLGLVKEYVLKNRTIIKPDEPGNLAKKLKYSVLNNPRLAGIASALCLPGLFNVYNNMLMWVDKTLGTSVYPPFNPNNVTTLLLGTIGYLAGYLSVELAKSNELVARGFREYRKRHYEEDKKEDKITNFYNSLFEHPDRAALIAGGGYFLKNMVDMYNGIGLGSQVSPALTAMWAGFSVAVAVFTYFGWSALSWAFHPNSLSLMKNILSRDFNSLFHRYEQAIKDQKELMEIPTTEANEFRNHLRLGDLYLNDDKLEQAVDEYYKAMGLINKKDRSYTNPLDVVSSIARSLTEMVGEISYLKERVVESLSQRKEIDSKVRLRRIANQTRHMELINADKKIREEVASDVLNPEAHLFYAKFLSAVGDRLAEKEYERFISLIMDDPEQVKNFERIGPGPSRREILTYVPEEDVFLDRKIVLVRNQEKRMIDDEYNALKIFNKELGERVAKPIYVKS